VSRTDLNPIHFGRTFVQSDAFRALFAEGMELIEDTAAYLDGPGREESRALGRQGPLTYDCESMRLTTRMTQVASWLLVQRAVAEGEITPARARAERNKVHGADADAGAAPEDFALLPLRLRELVGLAARLHARIMHLDFLISHAGRKPAKPSNPIARQRSLLARAFEGSAESGQDGRFGQD
jgi:regulator of CtrA degradation